MPLGFFVLDCVDEVMTTLADGHFREEYPTLFFFGGNAGLERIALDYGQAADPAVVMVDCIAGTESVETIARSIRELISAIGPYREDEQDN